MKRKVSVKFYVLILFGVLVAALVGLAIGLYFIGVSSGVDSVNTPPTLTTPGFSGTPNLGYRLPRVATPSHYKLTLFPNIYSADELQFSFQGWEIITFKPTVLTDRIFLYGHDMNIQFDELELYESQNLPDTEEPLPWDDSSHTNRKGDIRLVHYLNHSEFQYYELVFDKTLLLRDYKLKLAWTGQLTRNFRGLYYSKYNESGIINYIVGTQFQPTYARQAFPCFDEPDFKAVFESRLVRDSAFSSISNNEFIRSELVTIDEKQYTLDLFSPTVTQSTYLNAFAVHQYDKLDDYDAVKNISYRFWSRKTLIQSTEYVKSITKRILSDLDKKYGTKYPYTKMDFYPVPGFPGAMENWGLVVFGDGTYYYDPRKDLPLVKRGVASITAHELGHMNFGNIVTTKWWDDIWLNEGFATYMQYVLLLDVEPNWDHDNIFNAGTYEVAMATDSLNNTRPLTQYAETPAAIFGLFDPIAYDKGGSICRMMSSFLSDETFTKGLSTYLNTFKYNNVMHKNLFDSLTAITILEEKPLDVNAIMQGWTLQAGYPVLTAKLLSVTKGALRVNVSQAPFERNKDKFGDRIWSIPINSMVSVRPNVTNPTLNWLHTIQDIITIEDELIPADFTGSFVLNPESTGFYRVEYDETNWNRLTEQLLTDHTVFAKSARVQLLDDALNLARANYDSMQYPQALSMLSYLCKDTDYQPWQATLNNIEYIEQMLALTESYNYIKTYGKTLINNIYEFVGWQKGNDEPLSKHLLRSSVLSRACRWGSTKCTARAKYYFNQWKANSHYILPIDGSSTAQCYGIKSGTTADWWWLYELYKATEFESTRNKYISALGCSDDTTLLKRFLDVSIDKPYDDNQEFATIYAAVAANPTSRKMITQYFYDNWHKISAMPTSVRQKVLESTFQYVNTNAKLQQLQDWKNSAGSLGVIDKDYDKLVFNIGLNIEWLNEHGAEVTDWFKAFNVAPRLPKECVKRN